MRACGDAGLQFRVVGLVFRVRDKVGVSVKVSDGVRVSTFYFSSHQQPAESRIPAGPHFTHNRFKRPFIYRSVSYQMQTYNAPITG